MGLSKILSLISLAVSATASVLPQLAKRCTNSASSRSCWGNYDISTDYYNTWPDTGVTVEVSSPSPHLDVRGICKEERLTVIQYWLDMVNVTAAPDGVSRTMLLINGTLPGPTIEANWGDTVGKSAFNCFPSTGRRSRRSAATESVFCVLT